MKSFSLAAKNNSVSQLNINQPSKEAKAKATGGSQ